jgi:hypothetical protein
LIDPVSIGLAVAGARTAVKYIREAINLGHDIASMGKELNSFFTGQAEVEAAAKEAETNRKDPKNAGDKSATAIAMDCVLRAEELRSAERELRDMFALQGKIPMYERMCKIRAEIINQREKTLRDERKAVEDRIRKRKQFWQNVRECIEAAFCMLFFASVFVALDYFTVWLVYNLDMVIKLFRSTFPNLFR